MQPEGRDMWRNRRHMAWISLIGGLVFPLGALVEPSLANVAGPFYLFAGSVVGAYIGFATYHDKWGNKS